MTYRKLLFDISLIVIFLLAFALRIHLLGAQSLWNDEGSSYVQATRTLSDIASNAARDIHPPGYYWLLAGWRMLTGDSEFALRALSAFASLLTIAFTFALGRRLFGTTAGIAAALFVTANTFSIYYAQEARMYALLALWAVASMWALVAIIEPQRHREHKNNWDLRQLLIASLPLALMNAAGLYTQYAYAYVLFTQAAVVAVWLISTLWQQQQAKHMPTAAQSLLLKRLQPLSTFVLANVLALLLFLPWLPTALTQIGGWPNTGQSTPPLEALSVILNWLVYGITSQNASLAVAWLLALFGVWTLRREGWRMMLPILWVGISIGVFLAQGLFRENNLKFLLPAQIGMALWLGRGVWVLWENIRSHATSQRMWRSALPKAAGFAASALLLLTMTQGWQPLYHNPAYQRADYRGMAQLAEAELAAGDVIVLNGPNQAEVFNYYYRGTAQVVGLPAGLSGDDETTESAVFAIVQAAGWNSERLFVQVMGMFWGDRERDPNQIVESTLDFYGYSVGDVWYGDVRLARYVFPTALPAAWVNGEVIAELDGERLNLIASYTADWQRGEPLLVSLNWLNLTEQPIAARYKVFVQLLNSDGVLVAQHDSEPAGGSAPTNSWQLGVGYSDRHALLIPPDIPTGEYTLIAGMYDSAPPYARLPVDDGGDFVTLATIRIE
jgi:hypothetical protein